MTKRRKTTYEERVEMVKYCTEHETNCAQTAEKYQVSYQQIYQRIRKYQSNKVEGLVNRRRKRKTEREMSELEKLRAENSLLQAEKRKAELETVFLKEIDLPAFKCLPDPSVLQDKYPVPFHLTAWI